MTRLLVTHLLTVPGCHPYRHQASTPRAGPEANEQPESSRCLRAPRYRREQIVPAPPVDQAERQPAQQSVDAGLPGRRRPVGSEPVRAAKRVWRMPPEEKLLRRCGSADEEEKRSHPTSSLLRSVWGVRPRAGPSRRCSRSPFRSFRFSNRHQQATLAEVLPLATDSVQFVKGRGHYPGLLRRLRGRVTASC
jgi:hypothetical protein